MSDAEEQRFSEENEEEEDTGPFQLDGDLGNLERNLSVYNHCMFWERLRQCWTRMDESPEIHALMEDIFMFEKNPESKAVHDLVFEHLGGRQFWMDAGYEFWNQCLAKHPIIFASYASRMLLVFSDDHSPTALAFRMDALYGLDWVVPLLPKALKLFAEEELEALRDSLIGMCNRIFQQVLALLKIPEDLPIEEMDERQLDEYSREWNFAPQILCSIALVCKLMRYPLVVPDEMSEYLSTHLNHIHKQSQSFLLFGIRSTSEAYSKFQTAVLDSVVSTLQELCSQELFFITESMKGLSGAVGPSKELASGQKDDYPHYLYWLPEGDKNVQHIATCELVVIDAIHQILKDLIVVADVNRPALIAKMDILKPLLKNLLSFPLSPALRCSVCVILSVTHRNDAEMLELMWQAASKGPRPVDMKLDSLVAREAFVLYVCSDFAGLEASKRPKVTSAEMFEFALSDATPEAFHLHKDLLEALNPFQFELAQIPAPVLNGINLITDAIIKLSPEREIKHNMLDVLTDFIKRGGKQLKKFAPKITAALNRLCELPGYDLAVYSLGLWLGKYIEGKFGSSVDNIVLFHLCREVALRCLQRMKASDDLRSLSLPIYTLVRVCMFGFRSTDPSICDGLPALILANSPLPMAAEGDIIAFSTNSYIFDMVNMIPDEDMDDQMSQLVLDFYRTLVLNEGLIGEETIDLIKLNPNVMAHIVATTTAPTEPK
eukprot:TRINITY_DN7222_c0_g1_i1.p1 TRINITY_DN7222_c0_g1~~TRINITY_DN7222_c0_g1_i1.p1  ORF type:complete len:718 (-),score=117.17 TRINITY_DN7222_c0_g1_i1:13-2166(-)